MASDLRQGLALVLQPRARGNASTARESLGHQDGARGAGDPLLLRLLPLRKKESAAMRGHTAKGAHDAPPWAAARESIDLLSTPRLGDLPDLCVDRRLPPVAGADSQAHRAQPESSGVHR